MKEMVSKRMAEKMFIVCDHLGDGKGPPLINAQSIFLFNDQARAFEFTREIKKGYAEAGVKRNVGVGHTNSWESCSCTLRLRSARGQSMQ